MAIALSFCTPLKASGGKASFRWHRFGAGAVGGVRMPGSCGRQFGSRTISQPLTRLPARSPSPSRRSRSAISAPCGRSTGAACLRCSHLLSQPCRSSINHRARLARSPVHLQLRSSGKQCLSTSARIWLSVKPKLYRSARQSSPRVGPRSGAGEFPAASAASNCLDW